MFISIYSISKLTLYQLEINDLFLWKSEEKNPSLNLTYPNANIILLTVMLEAMMLFAFC
jgi:hypothetical protein